MTAVVFAMDYTWVSGDVQRDAHVLTGCVSHVNLAGVVVDGKPPAVVAA